MESMKESTIVSEDIASIINRLERKFLTLSNKHLLITGATGFIGSYLLETVAYLNDNILEEPCQLTFLTRDPDSFSKKRPHIANRNDFNMLTGNICNFDFGEMKCDFIIHAAAPADPHLAKTNPLMIMETITKGTMNVLELANRNEIKAMLFVSSGAVYRKQPPELRRIPEEFLQGPDLSKPESGYGEGKRYAEVLCTIYRERYNLPIKVARLFTFIGPYMDLSAEYAVTEFIRNCFMKKPIVIKSDGTPLRSYCYSADLATALWMILLSDAKSNVFNVGSEEEISIDGLANLVVSNFEKKPPIVIERPAAEPNKYPARYIPDITRLKEELGFTMQYNISNAIRRSVDWMKKKDSKFYQT